jgi:transcriptional regulator with XRE-family HTH domain
MPNPTKSKPADGNEMTQIVTRARVRQFRKRQLFTMREFAYALGYHPNYIRAVECGALPVSRIFATKFLRLEQDTYSKQIIQSRYILPREVLILAKARKCAGCKRSVILPYAHQKYCDATCRARAHQKSKRKEVRQ